MNYLEFYENAKRRIAETLLSMWASGQGATQKYLNDLLKEEPLLAEPVFQATFPWATSPKSFKELTEIFDHDFIDSLDQIKDPESRFPKDRPPYLHQVESWNQLLKQQRFP